MTQQPAIPVQPTIKSTYRAISKLNGDDLPKLKRVNRPELSNRVALYNTFTRGVLNTTLNYWFRQHASVMENLRKEQVHVYKSMCRMQRFKRRVQKDEHERRRQEIRKLFHRQRRRHLIRRVVEKFRQNVIRKKQEREEERLNQLHEESGISTENLAKIASGFRRMTEPNISTDTQREIEEALQDGTKEALKDDSKLPPLSPDSQSLVAPNNSVTHKDEAAKGCKQETENSSPSHKSSTMAGQTSKKSNKETGLRKKTSRKRKETLNSIPEAEALGEKDIVLQGDGTINRKSAKDFVKSPSTRSLPTDLSTTPSNQTIVNRRGSLPSMTKKADCVSSQSQLMHQRIAPKDRVRPISTENSPTSLSNGKERVNQTNHRTKHESVHDHAIKSVARFNASPNIIVPNDDLPDTASHHLSDNTKWQQSTDHDYFMQSEGNQFSHTVFYSVTPGIGLQRHTDSPNQSADSISPSALSQVVEQDDDENNVGKSKDSTVNHRSVTRSSLKSSAGQSNLLELERNGRAKPRKSSLAKQVRSEKICREKMRSDFLDKEPFTRYSRQAHGQVTPMYGQPRRKEFNPPTRKLQHEQEKMLRDEQNTELLSQIKIDNFFKDLFETQDTKHMSQPTKKSDDEKPKKQTLTLAGVLSQLYNAKDSNTNNKNSLEWLQKCQYLRVYNPMDKKQKERAHDSKISSWDEAEKKLQAGFLEMFYRG